MSVAQVNPRGVFQPRLDHGSLEQYSQEELIAEIHRLSHEIRSLQSEKKPLEVRGGVPND